MKGLARSREKWVFRNWYEMVLCDKTFVLSFFTVFRGRLLGFNMDLCFLNIWLSREGPIPESLTIICPR